MNMKTILEKCKNFLKEEDGASAIEYAIIAGLIAVGIIVAAGTLGEEISALFGRIETKLEGATGTTP